MNITAKTGLLMVYHSGSGSTRIINDILKEKLSDRYDITLKEIDRKLDLSIFDEHELIIFSFPTFGCEPPQSMREFIERLPAYENSKKAYVFTTCALYQENCLRHFIQSIEKKNILTFNYACIKGPASDGALFFPEKWKFIWNYEKNIHSKIENITAEIIKMSENTLKKSKIPLYKWYTPLNRAMLFFLEKQYESLKESIHLLPDRCVNCNLCVKSCHRESWKASDNNPVFSPENCELCLKCIHNCPHNAIIITDGMKDRPRLNKAFYSKKKQEILFE